jgi:DNA-binding beta-propeller fold protein YncE
MVFRRRLFSIVAAWLCSATGIVAACCAPAIAARGHVFGSAFGGKGTGEGQFSEPSGVAVNEASGDVYVVDEGNNRVELFDSHGTYIGQFNGSGLLPGEGSGAPTGQFLSPDGIVVDNSCVLHKPEPLQGLACERSDPSNGDVYVLDAGHAVIDKFSATGAYIGQFTGASSGSFRALTGVAVDSKGTAWVSGEVPGPEYLVNNFTNARVNEFLTTRAAEAHGLVFPGFAVDSEDNFYRREGFSGETRVEKYDRNGTLLSLFGPIDSENSTAVTVDLSSDTAYVDNVATVGVFDSGGALVERLGAGHLTNGTGIAVDSIRETVYVADSSTNVVNVFDPAPPSQPTVGGESAKEVTASSATLEAEVNPRSEAGEPVTEYRFEYGRCTTLAACPSSAFEHSLPTPAGALAPDFHVHTVTAGAANLQPATAYHFRVVATNAHGVTEGERDEASEEVVHTFTTRPAGEGGLPDGRAWELVSPPDKHGALIETIGEGQVTQASASGEAMTYVAAAPTEGEPQGNTNKVQVLSTRGPEDWQSKDISPPHTAATGLSQSSGQEYRFFSEDLASAAVQPFGSFISSSSPQALSPLEASEQTAFVRADYLNGVVSTPCVSSCYRPLVTGAPGFANVPLGTVFGAVGGGGRTCPPEIICGPQFAGATRDLSRAVLESKAALTKNAPSGGGLFEWSAGKPPGEQLTLISLLPNGEPSGGQPQLGYLSKTARNATSADGSRVVWSEHGGGEHLYLRDIGKEETVQLDATEPGCLSKGTCGSNSPEPVFQFASSDGSRVFFTDHQRLTESSGGGTNSSHKEDDLYECEIIVIAGKLACRLTDLTPVHAGEKANVLDEVLGASEDGSYVYFVANGALAEHAIHGTCAGLSSPAGATCNLYMAHYDGTGWHTTLVAVLSAEDAPDWNGNAGQSFLASITSRVSPNGRWVAFMSLRSLSGNDTRDVATGHPDEEVYLYDASSARIVCASCNPTGARPVGREYQDLRFGLDGLQVWNIGQRIAASVPAWTAFSAKGEARYQSRYLSNSGRLFFNSNEALVPQDVNGTGDVYEYEPPGIGDCTTSRATFSERSGGCVALISSGTSDEESGFLDASENGGDVFFLTAAKLSSQDFDTSLDVYDAHECTAATPCFAASTTSPPRCTTVDACRAAPSPPPSIFGVPPSATVSNSGNLAQLPRPHTKPLTRAEKLARALKACKKQPKGRGRAACERRARRTYDPPRARKPHIRGRR